MAIAIDHLRSIRQVPQVVGLTSRVSTVREELDPTPLGIARRPVALREPVLAVVPVSTRSTYRSAEVYERRRAIAVVVVVGAVLLAGIVGFMRGGDSLPAQEITVVPGVQVPLP